MRIVQLTPGTGSYYCGPCMRDNALVTELKRRGHDAVMAPLYLPPVLDESPMSGGEPLFYGGVNVYLQQKSRLFRRTPRWVDRMLDSPKVLQIAARWAGSTNARSLGDLTVSTLEGEDGHQFKELERLVAWLSDVEPDVVCLSNALLIGLARRIKESTGAAIVCTLQGEDVFLDALPDVDRETAWRIVAERAKDVDAFIAVSHYYAGVMRERAGLGPDRLHIVHNGINVDNYRSAVQFPDPPTIGFLARLCPEKGLDRLVDMYINLRRDDHFDNVKLCVAGSLMVADEIFVDCLKSRIEAAGLTDDVMISPDLGREEKIEFLKGLSVLTVPSMYGEAFGLYLIEAMAAGVPVVQPRSGAFPELILETGGGVLYEMENPESWAEAIRRLLSDPDEARAMGERGRLAVRENFTVERMTDGVMTVFEGVAG